VTLDNALERRAQSSEQMQQACKHFNFAADFRDHNITFGVYRQIDFKLDQGQFVHVDIEDKSHSFNFTKK